MSNIQQENGKVMARLSQRISKSGGNEETDVLYLGESIVVYDEHESFIGVKYGDGVNKIKDLPWASVGEETVRQWIGEKPLVKETNINGEYLRLGNTNNPIFQVTSNGSTAEMTLNGKDVVTYDQLTGTVPTRKIVSALPSTLTKNYIYMIPIEGTDEYEEYIVVEQNGKLTAIKSGQDLSNYTTKTYVSKTYATKSELTTGKTELNKKINDTLIDIAEKLPTTVENYTDDQGISPFLGMSPDVALRQDVATANFHQVMKPFETAKTVEITGNETVLNDADAIDAKVIQIETIEGNEITKSVEGGGYQRLGSELCIGYNADERLRFYGYEDKPLYLYDEQTLTHKGNGEYEINGTLETITEPTVSIEDKWWAEPIIIEAEKIGGGWYWDGLNLICKFEAKRPTEYHELRYLLIGDKIKVNIPRKINGEFESFYFSYGNIMGHCSIDYENIGTSDRTYTFTLLLLKEEYPDYYWIMNQESFQESFGEECIVKVQYNQKIETTVIQENRWLSDFNWSYEGGYFVYRDNGSFFGELNVAYEVGNGEINSFALPPFDMSDPNGYYSCQNNQYSIYLKANGLDEFSFYNKYGLTIQLEDDNGNTTTIENYINIEKPEKLPLLLHNPPTINNNIDGKLISAKGETIQINEGNSYREISDNNYYIYFDTYKDLGPFYFISVNYYEDVSGASSAKDGHEFILKNYKTEKKRLTSKWEYYNSFENTTVLHTDLSIDCDFYALFQRATNLSSLTKNQYFIDGKNLYIGINKLPYYFEEDGEPIQTWYLTRYGQETLKSIYNIEQALIKKELPIASGKTSTPQSLTVKYHLKYHKTPQENLGGDGLPLIMSINEVSVKRFKYKYWVYEPNKVTQATTRGTTAKASGSSWQESYIEGATEYIVDITYSEDGKLYAEASHVHLTLWHNNGYTTVIPMLAYRYNDREAGGCIGIINARFQFNKSNDESGFLTMVDGTHNTSLSPNGTEEYLSDAYNHNGNWTFNILASKI